MTKNGSQDLPEELDRRLHASGPQVAPASGELDALVELGRRLGKDLAPPAPRAAFLAASPARLLRRIGEETLRPRSSFGVAFLRPAWSLAAAVLALAFTLGSTGLVFAAGGAVPGDRLYGVKRGIEALQLAASLSPQGDARLLMGFADERLGEVLALLPAGRGADFASALEGYDLALADLMAAPGAETLEAASDHLQNHILMLEAARGAAPESGLPGLDQALENSRHGLEELQARDAGLSPGDLAPGQAKKLLRFEEGAPGAGSDGPGNGQGRPENPGAQGRGRGKKDPTATVTATATPTPTLTPTPSPQP